MTRVLRGGDQVAPQPLDVGDILVVHDTIFTWTGAQWSRLMDGRDARDDPHRAWLLMHADWPYTEMLWDDAAGAVLLIAWMRNDVELELVANRLRLRTFGQPVPVTEVLVDLADRAGSGVWRWRDRSTAARFRDPYDLWELGFSAPAPNHTTRMRAELFADALLKRLKETHA